MMEANEYQIGGDHYKVNYEHWDMVCDVNLHYLLATASKYACRWREKNGVEDLRKALHYIRKYDERGYGIIRHTMLNLSCIEKFARQFPNDRHLIFSLCHGHVEVATNILNRLIADEELAVEPGRNYVDQDGDTK